MGGAIGTLVLASLADIGPVTLRRSERDEETPSSSGYGVTTMGSKVHDAPALAEVEERGQVFPYVPVRVGYVNLSDGTAGVVSL